MMDKVIRFHNEGFDCGRAIRAGSAEEVVAQAKGVIHSTEFMDGVSARVRAAVTYEQGPY